MTTSDGVSSSGLYGFKNRIINGAMVIDQRNAGASVTPTGNQFILDRWSAYITQSSKFSVQQNAGSVTPPAGFTKYLGVTSLSAYSIGAGDIFTIGQPIEGLNISDFGWGTATAATVTLSFWVRSSLTGTFGGSIINSAFNRSYPFSYTISAANTWEQKSIIIAGDTSGTWLTTNGVGLYLTIGLGVGSTYSGTAGSWSGSQYWSATGATSVVGTNGATFYITGVQLEKGSVATSFDYRPYGTELALCKRYYQIMQPGNGAVLNLISLYSTTHGESPFKFDTEMRSAPSLVATASQWSIGGSTASSIGINNVSSYVATVDFTATGFTAGQVGVIKATGAGSVIGFSSEL